MLFKISLKDVYGEHYARNELWDWVSLLINGAKNLQHVPLGSKAGLAGHLAAYCRGGAHSWRTPHPSGCLSAAKVRIVVTFRSLLSSFSLQFFIDPFYSTFNV